MATIIATMSVIDFLSEASGNPGVINATMTNKLVPLKDYAFRDEILSKADPTTHSIIMIGIEPAAHNGQSSHKSLFAAFESNYLANKAFEPVRGRIQNAVDPLTEINDGRTIYLVVPNAQLAKLETIGSTETFPTIEEMRTRFKTFYEQEHKKAPNLDAAATPKETLLPKQSSRPRKKPSFSAGQPSI